MRLAPLLLIISMMSLLFNTPQAAPELFTIGETLTVELEIPDGWSSTPQGVEAEGGIAILIEPPGDIPLVLLVTPLAADQDLPDIAAHIRSIVEDTATQLQEIAVEDNLTPRRIQGAHCEGLYLTVTDRTVEKPSLEDFKYLDQGLVALGDLLMTFTVLTNVPDSPERIAALEIVRSARQFGSKHADQNPAALILSDVLITQEDLPDDCNLESSPKLVETLHGS